MSNTSVPAKVNTFVAGQTIRAALVNQDFDDLYTGLANVGTANLLADAITTIKILDLAVTEAKLAAAVTLKLEQTGVVKDYIGLTAPSGYVLASGLTMGNAASGGTGRANADTEALFLLIYGAMADAEAPVSGGRGASAAADYAANKTIVIPDLRGRVVAGKDNMGGTTASRLTSASGIVGTTMGEVGGTETHVLVTGELAAHLHGVTDPTHSHTSVAHDHTITDAGHIHIDNTTQLGGVAQAGAAFNAASSIASQTGTTTNSVTGIAVNASGVTINAAATSVTTQNAGSGTAHQNTQPTFILNKIIKL